jgi:hypothetical protein
MLINLSVLLTQIQTARVAWDLASPTLPSPNNLQNTGVSISDITRSFDEVTSLIQSIDGIEVDGVFVAGSGLRPGMDSMGTTLAQHLTAYQGNTAQLNSIIPQICSWLHSLKTQLVQFVPAKKYTPKLEREMSEKIAAVEQWALQLKDLNQTIEQSRLVAERSLTELTKHQDLATSSVGIIQELLIKIEALERSAATAKTNAESAAVSATTDSSEVKDLAKNLADSVIKKDVLFTEFENRREEISGLLENANKVGLAKSFQDKRKELTNTWKFWAALFLFGIGTLVFIGNTQFFPLLEKTTIEPASLIVRLMLTGPVIWFTWFSARQYAHVLRIGEDYSFKEAAAMAYVGYRNEVDADPEMLKLLQEYAIKNFGKNPADLLLKQVEASTPLHDLLDKVLEKMKAEDVIKLLKPKD